MHVLCIHVRASWGRKREKLKNDGFLKHFWRVREAKSIYRKRTARRPRPAEEPLGPLWRHFGVTLDALWGHFGYIRMALCHFTITLESLWKHFRCLRVDFQKTFIFPIDFNHFIKPRFEVWIDSGLLWGYFWHMKRTLGPLWAYFGVTLGI